MWITKIFQEKKQACIDKCEILINQIKIAKVEYNSIFADKSEFITIETTLAWKKKHQNLLNELEKKKLDKLKRAFDYYRKLVKDSSDFTLLISSLENTRNMHNKYATDNRVNQVYSLIGEVEEKTLDKQQLVAISKRVHNHLVIAGAGTGKTTTIVGLIKYLIKADLYKADEILVLSFTNASASEMKERIQNETSLPIEASTFHKLGINIISSVDNITPKISKLKQRKFISDKLSELMQNQEYLRLLNNYMIQHKVSIKSEFDFNTEQEYREYLKQNPPITLKRESVKSYGEMEIANFLYLNGIEYIYEKAYEIDTRTQEYGQYHPDFFLPEYNIYIEYFGIDKNGNPPAYFQNDYIASMKWKRELHKTNNTVMIEAYAYENFDGTLLSVLERELSEKSVMFNPKSQQELWEQISDENKNILDGLIQLFETVINLMKSNRYTIDDVRSRNAELLKSRETEYLLALIEPIWNSYNETLNRNNEIDFNDMINMAVDYIRAGKYVNQYRMVIVDEYQDISKARFELLKALRQSSDYDLFCVGDDWQSIYRFAGSDISFIQNFSDYWGSTEISKIETTYRFPQRLIDISSGFIMKNPLQIKKSIRGVRDSSPYVLGAVQGYTERYAVQFMLNKFDELPFRSTVFLLGRYSFDIKILQDCQELQFGYDNVNMQTIILYQKRKDLKISFLTAHKSKGLQADYVFIINNKQGKMGFPSQIQDSPVLDLLLEQGDKYPFAEERRLFYVAMTRAKQKVILVTLKDKESEFVQELRAKYDKEMRQEAFICPLCGGKLMHKKGPYGEFMGCENYRSKGCRYIRNIRRQSY